MKGLRTLGLSDGEIKVYEAILNTGLASLNAIHEKVGIERRNIYDIINKLIEKGLVSYTKEERTKKYQCVNPQNLLVQIEKRKSELENLKKDIPNLAKIYQETKPPISAQVYRGRKGIKAIFEDMLNHKKNYFIGGGWYIVKIMPYFWVNYNRRRIKLRVKWYDLLRYEFKKTRSPEHELVEVRYLPKEFSGNPNVIFIYGNKVANVLWSDQFFAFVIESKEIADNYRRYHKYLWTSIAKA